jgi:hypothetical protein
MRPAPAYLAAGKLTKTKWLLILGVAFVLGLYSAAYGGVTGFLSVIAFVAAAVYLSDVRPKVKEFRKGTTHWGPYGPWLVRVRWKWRVRWNWREPTTGRPSAARAPRPARLPP